MNKNYIIDAYNLGFKIPSISKRIKSGQTDTAIQMLKTYISAALIHKANKILLVFDGKSESGAMNSSHGKIRILFSKKPESADDIIREHIRSSINASYWIVVTSDSEIRYTAEDMGAEVITSENFITTVSQTRKKDISHSNKEKYNPQNVDMDYWLRKFDQSGDNSE